jgi:predicted transcriptional regulator
MNPPPAQHQGLSQDQLDAIQAFEADFNAVDHFLRAALGAPKQHSFPSLVRAYREKHRGWRDADLLESIADIRNAIVHGKTQPYGYPAVPAPGLCTRLAECRKQLTDPVRAIQVFERRVESLSSDDTLAKVLRRVAERDYSQFPVYSAGRFRGLLTENGMTRWLAAHISSELSLIEFDDVRVKDVLAREEHRPNCSFVPRDARADDVRALFAESQLLEAVLITQTGKDSEALLGIATRWDISRLR